MTIDLEPFAFGPRDDDDEELPLAPSEQGSPLGPMLQPGQAADVMSQVGVEPPQQPYEAPPMPPALARQAAEAQQVGDAYRANPANRQREPFGSLAARMAGLGPDGQPLGQLQQPPQPDGAQWPPAGAQAPAAGVPGLGDPRVRERLQQLLQARRQAPQQAQSPAPARPTAIDAGQPGARAGGEPDFTGADLSDAIRRPLHAIASALRVAGGSAPLPFRSERAQTEARLREQRETDAQQQQQGMALERLGMQREEMDARREDRALDREDRTADRDLRQSLSERQMQLAEQRASVAMEMSRAQLGRIQSEAERDAAADDPASEPSRTARLALRTALAGYPPEARQRLAEQMGVEDLDAALGPDGTLSQRAADTLMRSMPSMFRDTTNRRGGGARRAGGGGGGGGAALEALSTPPEGWQGSPEQWAALSVRDRRAAVRSLGVRTPARGAGGEGNDGTEVIPGVMATTRDTVEVRAARAALRDARAQSAALGTIDEIARRYGSQAVVDPRIEAELVGPTQAMMAMVATLRNTGVINPSEAPTIEAAIPNPRNFRQMTLGEVQRRINSFRTLIEQRITGHLATIGVDDAGQREATQFLRTGRTRARAQRGGGDSQPTADTVRVRHPDGRTGTIPRANLERARQAGFEEVP